MKLSNQDKQRIWREHLAAAKASSGSVEAYCAANGVSTASFYYWKKKFGRGSRLPAISSFVPVEVMTAQNATSGLPDPKWLAEFIVHLSGGGK